MHEAFSVTLGDESQGADDTDPVQPTRPVTALIRLGAPVVGDLEPPPPAADVPSDPTAEQAETRSTPAEAITDTSVLRRAALLRLVGLGRSRALR